MDPQSFYNQAVAAGHNPDQVKAYMQAKGYNTDLIDISGNSAPVALPGPSSAGAAPSPTAASTPSTPQAPAPVTPPVSPAPTYSPVNMSINPNATTKSRNQPLPTMSVNKNAGKANGIGGVIEDWAPTAAGIAGSLIGNVLVPGAGGAVGAGVASGGTQAIVDLLEGKNLADTAKDALTTGGLNAATEGLGGLGLKLGGKVLAGVGEKLLPKIGEETFSKVVDASPSYGPALQKVVNIADKYGLTKVTPQAAINKLPQVMKGINDQITGLLSKAAPVDRQAALDDFDAIISKNSKYFNSDGTLKAALDDARDRIVNVGTTSNPVANTILDATGKPIAPAATKSVSPLDLYNLKGEFGDELSNAFKKIDRGGVLSPAEEAKMIAWNSLKGTLDKVAPEVRSLNDEQHMMYPIATGIVKAAQGAGKSAGGFIGNILTGGVAESAAEKVGNMIPGLGFLAGLGAKHVLENPGALVNAGEKVAGQSAQMIGSAVGAAAGGVLRQTVLPPIGADGKPQAQQEENQADNQTHSSITVPPSLQNYKPDTQTGMWSLKPLDTATVLGTNYISPDQYVQEIASNPTKYAPGSPARSALDTAFQVGQEQAKEYKANNPVSADDRAWMQNSAPTMIASVNTANQLAKTIPPSVLNRISTINDLKSIDSEDYAKLAAVTKFLATEVGKMQQGGILRSYDLTSLNDIMPSTGDSPTQFQAKMDLIGALTTAHYQNLYVPYTLVVGGAPAGVNQQSYQQATGGQ